MAIFFSKKVASFTTYDMKTDCIRTIYTRNFLFIDQITSIHNVE